MDNLKERHLKVINELQVEDNILEKDFAELENVLKGIFYLKELNQKILDKVMSFGEIFSAKIIAEYLNRIGIKSKAYMAYDIGFITDSNFGNAEILDEAEYKIREAFKYIHEDVSVITGYIAKNKKNEITTLGRGGGDYTATILGAALNVEEIQIWTDVDGIMTADPKIVKNARSIDEVSYQEASELAFFGAKVLHPKTFCL
jgi:Aspartokinases